MSSLAIKTIDQVMEDIERFKLESIPMKMGDMRVRANEDNVLVSDEGFELTDHAKKQILRMAGIPDRYFKKCEEGLRTENFEYWREHEKLDQKDILVKCVNKTVYGVLDPMKMGITNKQVYDLLTESDAFKRFEVFQNKIDHFSFEIRAMIGDKELKRDEIYPGVHIGNSEVGRKKFEMIPTNFRVVCQNGMMDTHNYMRRIRYGTYSALRDNFENNLFATLKSSLEMKKSYVKLENIKLENIDEVVEDVLRKLHIKREYKDNIMSNWQSSDLDGHSTTAFGLVNAINAYARDIGNFDERVKLEQKACEAMRMLTVA